MEDMEEDLEFHRKKTIEPQSNFGIARLPPVEGKMHGRLFFFNWKATSSGSSGMKLLMDVVEKKPTPQSFFFCLFEIWGVFFFGNGHLIQAVD